MNCPVCARSLAPTLSICPTCGAMMNDTVREELQPKITSGNLPRLEPNPEMAAPRAVIPARPPMAPPPTRRTATAGLTAPKTSPTLVDFKNKNTQLPEWRLQIQNAVQQRKGGRSAAPTAAPAVSFPTNGSAAINAEPARTEAEMLPETADPRVAKAMSRIAESRKVFTDAPAEIKARMPQRAFEVVPASTYTGSAAQPPAPTRTVVAKPKLVAPPVIEKRDTNKLPPIGEVVAEPIAAPVRSEALVQEPTIIDEIALETPSGKLVHEIKRIQIKVDKIDPSADVQEDAFEDEIEDLAPFSMRFGAGLFDMIIGGFATMLILSPFAFTNSSWFTAAGLLTFVGALALVSFVYMTVSVGFYGKTVGMRLFSLELVDAVDNEYPTLRQAAVNASIFLISLTALGAGFLTTFFNEERRALHDLLSGTILVREF